MCRVPLLRFLLPINKDLKHEKSKTREYTMKKNSFYKRSYPWIGFVLVCLAFLRPSAAEEKKPIEPSLDRLPVLTEVVPPSAKPTEREADQPKLPVLTTAVPPSAKSTEREADRPEPPVLTTVVPPSAKSTERGADRPEPPVLHEAIQPKLESGASTPHPALGALSAKSAETRISALKDLVDTTDLAEDLQERLIKMALWDPVVSVRMEAEKALSRMDPLTEQERQLSFQLSSPSGQDKRSALISLMNHPALGPFLQYRILKEIVFSPINGIQGLDSKNLNQTGFEKGAADEVISTSKVDKKHENSNKTSIDSLDPVIPRLTDAFLHRHLLMQKTLLNGLSQLSIYQDRAQAILSRITPFPVIQWKLIQTATALPRGRSNIPREKAFEIINQLSHLHKEVEMELIKIAFPINNMPYETTSLLEAMIADKSLVDSSLLAYNILIRRSSLTTTTENELAELAVSNKSHISDRKRERITNILQKQISLDSTTEEILIKGLSSFGPTDNILETVKRIVHKKPLDLSTQNALLGIMSNSSNSSKAQKTARRILLHTTNLKPEVSNKAGLLFQCQRAFTGN